MGTIHDLRAGLLAREVALLERRGYTISHTEDVGGIWQLVVIAPDEKTGAGEIVLEIALPASYPLLPPTVSTSSISLAHHQHPSTGVLCLIEGSTQSWIPEWHVAGLLDNQLRAVIAAGRAPIGEGEREYDQGEPASAYLEYLNAAGVLIDTGLSSTPEGSSSGEFELKLIAVENTTQVGYTGPDPQVRQLGVVTEMSSTTHMFYRAPESLLNVLATRRVHAMTGRWTAHAKTPAMSSAKDLWQLASELDPGQPMSHGMTANSSVQWRALSFPEEHARGVYGTGWIFLLKVKTVPSPARQSKKRGGHPAHRVGGSSEIYAVRASRAGVTDLTHRAPETVGLSAKRALVIGCGAIGSVATEHLARAGLGNFILIDSDVLEPGNLSRHAGDFQFIGMNKTIAMAQRIAQINPYASVRAVPLHLGGPIPYDGKTDSEWMEELCAEVDIVIDASAEIGVQQYSSLVARERGLPWVCLDATPGVGGGTVVRIDRDSDFCYGCLLWHQHDSTIPEAIAVDSALVQPVGCTSPTFTGTGFDLAMVSLQATRVVVGALLREMHGAYPEDGFDVHILTLRDENGGACPPSWQGLKLERNLACREH